MRARGAVLFAVWLCVAAALSAQERPLPTDLPGLEREIVRAWGGNVAVNGLMSAVRNGVERLPNGRSYAFSLWQRRPQMVRLERRAADGQLLRAATGERGWWADGAATGTGGVLAAGEALAAARQWALVSPAVGRAADVRLVSLQPAAVAGLNAVEAVFAFGDGAELAQVFDTASYVVRRQEYRPVNGPAQEIVFDDYRLVGGLRLAHRWTVREAGAVVSEVEVTAARVNVGLLPTLFEQP